MYPPFSLWDPLQGRFVREPAQKIAVGPGGEPWVLSGNDGKIFRWTGRRWVQFPGTAQDINVGADGSAWIVTSPYYVPPAGEAGGTTTPGAAYRWNGVQWLSYGRPMTVVWKNPFGWVRAVGLGRAISVGPRGEPYIVTDAGEVFVWNGTRWLRLPGSSVSDVGVGVDGSLWALRDFDRRAYSFSGVDWYAPPGSATPAPFPDYYTLFVSPMVPRRIAVTPSGVPLVVNEDGRVYVRRGF